MRHNHSFVQLVERRISQLHRRVKLDTNEMRNRWITELESLFDMATPIAKGEISQGSDKLEATTPKERQMWAQTAANIATVMGNLSKTYDERQTDEDLDRLESYMIEIEAKREKEAEANSTVTSTTENSEKNA